MHFFKDLDPTKIGRPVPFFIRSIKAIPSMLTSVETRYTRFFLIARELVGDINSFLLKKQSPGKEREFFPEIHSYLKIFAKMDRDFT